MPPAYSAKKVAGRRAYALARRGPRPVALTPVPVRVTRAELLEFDGDVAPRARSPARPASTCGRSPTRWASWWAPAPASRRCGGREAASSRSTTALPLDDAARAGARRPRALIPLDRLLLGLPGRHGDRAKGCTRVSHGQRARARRSAPATAPPEPAADVGPAARRRRARCSRSARRRAPPGSLHPAVVLI